VILIDDVNVDRGESRVQLVVPLVSRDPDAEALVTQIRALGQPAMCERGVEGARAYLEDRAATAPAGPPVAVVEDETLPTGVAVRIYHTALADQPVVVYLHGGGWVVGSVAASDAFCRRLVVAAGCTVVSVDYRLAPEHPFPAAVEDAVAAIEWTTDRAAAWGADRKRLVVLGDSAGGNLATVAVRRLLGAGPHVVARPILAYPGVSAERGPTSDGTGTGTGSGTGSGSEWPLTDADRAWYFDQYVPDETKRTDPDVAPLLADVSGLPPTTLLLGGCDPIVQEGLAYAEHLCAAGVSVDLHLYFGQIHGFLTFDESILPRSTEALGLVANAVRTA
jgi:acetyl esterase